MKRILMAAAAVSLLVGAVSAVGVASAEPDRQDSRVVVKDRTVVKLGGDHNWRKGGRIEQNDWARGAPVDYRVHRLSAPPRGYEWREVDGNYVLAAVAGGLIASVLLANQ